MEKYIKGITEITGKPIDNKLEAYYVYALFEKNGKFPFYVGKGKGSRIGQHLKESKVFFNKSKDNKLLKLNDKTNKIIKNNGEIEHVIIKFGLTEQEAFYVESGIINLLNFSYERDNLPKLTNIVRGHGTTREKDTFSKDGEVKARTIKDFIENYKIESFNFDYIEEKCLFIKINQTYTVESTNEEIYHHTRGVWRLNEKRKDHVEYVISLYEGFCVGVFKPEGWKRAYEHSKEFPFPERSSNEESIIVKAKDLEDLKKTNIEIYNKFFGEFKNNVAEKNHKKWKNSFYFYGKYDNSNIPNHLKNAIGKRIEYSKKNFKTQGSIFYNF